MQLDDFVMAAAAGFLATYVHMVLALWAPRFGLPRLDFAKALTELSFAGRSKATLRIGSDCWPCI